MELAPVVDSVVSQFTAAKLVYKLIGYQALAKGWSNNNKGWTLTSKSNIYPPNDAVKSVKDKHKNRKYIYTLHFTQLTDLETEIDREKGEETKTIFFE